MSAKPSESHLGQNLERYEKPLICPECSKRFAKPDLLRDHQRSHTRNGWL
ncbi:uncharacterized protein CIMG_13249 [Coccidioides immitis RS]|uniref:C2H2-type domain-containing protein n=1 Tax=Coccidioides immitis (strain RS) TaxID=246410 RepID=A0A0D8JX04_COCIM|nr:uncharacterized protein CIMG_13249 [Coccidioides immitis RS]KJF60808.1 hypothetical protein CIMG_13249 [Coccidioides immitis RS]